MSHRRVEQDGIFLYPWPLGNLKGFPLKGIPQWFFFYPPPPRYFSSHKGAHQHHPSTSCTIWPLKMRKQWHGKLVDRDVFFLTEMFQTPNPFLPNPFAKYQKGCCPALSWKVLLLFGSAEAKTNAIHFSTKNFNLWLIPMLQKCQKTTHLRLTSKFLPW